MQLVFIHGWGFDPSFWDGVAALLSDVKQHRLDLGFFGTPSLEITDDPSNILIGHSLGFVHGLPRQNWKGWIAINSFPRFVRTETSPGCSSAAELRDIRLRTSANPSQALKDFHGYIGVKASDRTPSKEALLKGIDELHDSDVSQQLTAPGLVLASKNDPLVPVATSENLAQSAKAEILWHATAGHILPQKDAAWCASAIRDFTNRHFT